MKKFYTGEPVRIECQGVRTTGVILMASSNGKSLMLSFDAMLDGHAGMMPVSLDDDGNFYSIFTGTKIKVEKRNAD